MRYQDPILQDKLAAEYVMGNLTGQARRRFERLLLQYSELQEHVTSWTARLHPLNEDIAPVIPPESVWVNISAQLDVSSPEPFWKNPIQLRKFAMIAASLLLLLSVTVYFLDKPILRVVVVKNQKSQTEWVVETRTRSQRVLIQTINPPTLPKNQVCILWLVWKDGSTRSIGELSDQVGQSVLKLPHDLNDKPEMANVVVSVEKRGVKIEKPTGEIVFNGPWSRL